MAQASSNRQPISKRGQDLYERQLRDYVETEENIGKIIVFNVETGDYAIDADGLIANKKLRAEHPEIDPNDLFAIRIGYNAVFAIGGTLTRTNR
jgi:hypothetical protein